MYTYASQWLAHLSFSTNCCCTWHTCLYHIAIVFCLWYKSFADGRDTSNSLKNSCSLLISVEFYQVMLTWAYKLIMHSNLNSNLETINENCWGATKLSCTHGFLMFTHYWPTVTYFHAEPYLLQYKLLMGIYTVCDKALSEAWKIRIHFPQSVLLMLIFWTKSDIAMCETSIFSCVFIAY